jgi:hypothetical protein
MVKKKQRFRENPLPDPSQCHAGKTKQADHYNHQADHKGYTNLKTQIDMTIVDAQFISNMQFFFSQITWPPSQKLKSLSFT